MCVFSLKISKVRLQINAYDVYEPKKVNFEIIFLNSNIQFWRSWFSLRYICCEAFFALIHYFRTMFSLPQRKLWMRIISHRLTPMEREDMKGGGGKLWFVFPNFSFLVMKLTSLHNNYLIVHEDTLLCSGSSQKETAIVPERAYKLLLLFACAVKM